MKKELTALANMNGIVEVSLVVKDPMFTFNDYIEADVIYRHTNENCLWINPIGFRAIITDDGIAEVCNKPVVIKDIRVFTHSPMYLDIIQGQYPGIPVRVWNRLIRKFTVLSWTLPNYKPTYRSELLKLAFEIASEWEGELAPESTTIPLIEDTILIAESEMEKRNAMYDTYRYKQERIEAALKEAGVWKEDIDGPSLLPEPKNPQKSHETVTSFKELLFSTLCYKDSVFSDTIPDNYTRVYALTYPVYIYKGEDADRSVAYHTTEGKFVNNNTGEEIVVNFSEYLNNNAKIIRVTVDGSNLSNDEAIKVLTSLIAKEIPFTQYLR